MLVERQIARCTLSTVDCGLVDFLEASSALGRTGDAALVLPIPIVPQLAHQHTQSRVQIIPLGT